MEATEIEQHYSTRERQDLIYKYLLENTDKNHVVSTSRLIGYLGTFDIQTHINTLYKDLKEIEMVYGVSIGYDQKKKGYQLTDTLFKPYEVRLIAHSIQSFKFITEKKARYLIDRLKQLTDQYTAKSIYSDAYVLGRIHHNNDGIVESADRIYQAIVEDKQIRFDVSAVNVVTGAHRTESHIVSPYKLMWKDGNLFALVFEDISIRKDFVVFRVDQLQGISKPLNIIRDGKKEYKEHLEKITRNRAVDYGSFFHGTAIDVKIRINSLFLPDVIDKFGSDISIVPDGPLYSIVSLTIDFEEDFFDWLLTFGDGAKILFPQKLAAGMKEYIKHEAVYLIKEVLPMYNDDGGA